MDERPFSDHGLFRTTADADIDAGDRVLRIGDEPLDAIDWEGMIAVRNGWGVSDQVEVELSRAGREPWTITTSVVDWLPDYDSETTPDARGP